MIVFTDDNGINIELHGREQFWALRAKITIPLDTITDVQFMTKFQDWRKWEVRMPGASIPGKLVAGSYWTEEGWDFLYARSPRGFNKPLLDDVLVIQTTEERYKRIIISSDANESSGIIKWWNKKKKQLAQK